MMHDMNKPTPTVQPNNKLLGLEVIRFISALSVLAWHYQHFFYINYTPEDFIKSQQPLYHLLRFFYDHGFYGVQIFWCNSGFIFFWKYREAIASNVIAYKKFFVLRFSRLYPLHVVTLVLVLLLQAIYFFREGYFFVYKYNDLTHFVFQIFLASHWGLEKGYSFNGPIWSVSVEVLIYCFFFVTLRVIGKSSLINVAVLILYLAAKLYEFASPILDCLAFFYMGGWSAVAFMKIQNTKYRKPIFWLALFALLLLPLCLYVANVQQHKYFAQLFLIAYVPFLLYFSAHDFNAAPFVQKAIEAAGNTTYSSYLIHFPIQLVAAIYFSMMGQKIPYYSVVFFAGFMITTLVLSHYIYKLFELPVQNHIRRKWI